MWGSSSAVFDSAGGLASEVAMGSRAALSSAVVIITTHPALAASEAAMGSRVALASAAAELIAPPPPATPLTPAPATANASEVVSSNIRFS